MPIWLKRTLFFLLLVYQVNWLLTLRNDIANPFRRAERQKAMLEWGRSKSPEATAAWNEEIRLLKAHVAKQDLLTVTAFFVIDGIAICYLWNSRRGKQKAHQSLPAVPG